MSSPNAPHPSPFLIAGLGNPGSAYDATRHNIGFRVVRKMAEKYGWKFRDETFVSGKLATGQIEEHKVLLLMPMTYMNSSGESVRRCVEYFKLSITQVMVVCDEVALPVGVIRLRERGSAGGHNGLKSVEDHVKTTGYPRFRIGVGDRAQGDLADHVLSQFTAGEEKQFPAVLDRVIQGLEIWMKQGIQAAMNMANMKEFKDEETEKTPL